MPVYFMDQFKILIEYFKYLHNTMIDRKNTSGGGACSITDKRFFE
jgi:hypothetical protein